MGGQFGNDICEKGGTDVEDLFLIHLWLVEVNSTILLVVVQPKRAFLGRQAPEI